MMQAAGDRFPIDAPVAMSFGSEIQAALSLVSRSARAGPSWGLPGVGQMLTRRTIEGRPDRSVDDLGRIKGSARSGRRSSGHSSRRTDGGDLHPGIPGWARTATAGGREDRIIPIIETTARQA
jgi:hypothetical protein